jgi:hypothetical protein
MPPRINLVLLAVALALVGLTGFALDTVIAPKPLQAQACGGYAGPYCGYNCLRECSNGSCCSILHYYYPKPAEET